MRLFPHEEVSYGFKTTPVMTATIAGSRMLTKAGSHKTTMELKLEVQYWEGVRYVTSRGCGQHHKLFLSHS